MGELQPLSDFPQPKRIKQGEVPQPPLDELLRAARSCSISGMGDLQELKDLAFACRRECGGGIKPYYEGGTNDIANELLVASVEALVEWPEHPEARDALCAAIGLKLRCLNAARPALRGDNGEAA